METTKQSKMQRRLDFFGSDRSDQASFKLFDRLFKYFVVLIWHYRFSWFTICIRNKETFKNGSVIE